MIVIIASATSPQGAPPIFTLHRGLVVFAVWRIFFRAQAASRSRCSSAWRLDTRRRIFPERRLRDEVDFFPHALLLFRSSTFLRSTRGSSPTLSALRCWARVRLARRLIFRVRAPRGADLLAGCGFDAAGPLRPGSSGSGRTTRAHKGEGDAPQAVCFLGGPPQCHGVGELEPKGLLRVGGSSLSSSWSSS